MIVLAGACVAIGLAPVVFWPAVARAVGTWRPVWVSAETPAPLSLLGLVHITLAALVIITAGWLWRRARQNGLIRALTWDCGYAIPTARMQYTAGSFAGIITEWFAWILRPVPHEHRPEGPFPLNASFTTHSPDPVLERVVTPAGTAVMRVSRVARSLQQGRLQSYLAYLLIGLAAVAGLVLFGGGP
jgi:hydrogenase-4 component B